MDLLGKWYIIWTFFITCCIPVSRSEPFISSWMSIRSQTAGPFVVHHYLGEYPAKVDVQLNVTKDGEEYIFSGIGTAQRDDDRDKMYGGVVYRYNDQHVKLYVPKSTGISSYTAKGRLVYTGGSAYTGPFASSFQTGFVRIRAWRLCDFPRANFSSDGVYDITSKEAASSFVRIPHSLGDWPTFVVVQVMTSDGYIFEAEGAVFVPIITYYGGSTMFSRLCGTVYSVNNLEFRLWAPFNTGGSAVSVFCVVDGWGSEQLKFNSGTVYINAWVLEADHVVFNHQQTYGKNIASPNTVNLGNDYNIDEHITFVQVKSINDSFMFPAAGSAMSDGSFGSFGGVVYGFTENKVLLWRPADNQASGHVIYIGGKWGNGVYSTKQNVAYLKVSILYFPSTDSCGKSCVNGSYYRCDCTSGVAQIPIMAASSQSQIQYVSGNALPSVMCNMSTFSTLVNLKTVQYHIYGLEFRAIVAEQHLNITHFSVISTGKNIKCLHMDMPHNASNYVNVNFFISNFGIPSKQTALSADDEMIIRVDYQPHVLAQPFDVFHVTNGVNPIVQLVSTTVFLGNSSNESNLSTNYTISITNACSEDCIGPGDNLEFMIDVSTEFDQCYAPFELEFPFSANTSSLLKVCSYEIVKIGSNFPCLVFDEIFTNENRSIDGSIENVIIRFPRFCNLKVSNDITENVISIRVRVSLKEQDQPITTSGGPTELCVQTRAHGSHSQIWPCYSLSLRQITSFPGLTVVDGISVPTTQTFLSVNRSLLISVDGSNYEIKEIGLSLVSIGVTMTEYGISNPLLATDVVLSRANACLNVSCCVQYQFRSSPVTDYLKFYNDPMENLIKNVSLFLDKSNTSCMTLPSNGDTPPVFLMKMNASVLLGVSGPQFTILLHGEGIVCERHNGKSSIQVSVPVSDSQDVSLGSLKFCSSEETTVTTFLHNNVTSCQFKCLCDSTDECSEVFFFIATDKQWKLCEISALP